MEISCPDGEKGVPGHQSPEGGNVGREKKREEEEEVA